MGSSCQHTLGSISMSSPWLPVQDLGAVGFTRNGVGVVLGATGRLAEDLDLHLQLVGLWAYWVGSD